MNNKVVHEENIVASDSVSGTSEIYISKGGLYELKIALCNVGQTADVCSESAVKDIVVADTDGSHLPALNMNIGENNIEYCKKD